MDTEAAAEVFGVAPNTLRQLARRGEGPVQPLRMGRVLRWPTALVFAAVGITDHNDES